MLCLFFDTLWTDWLRGEMDRENGGRPTIRFAIFDSWDACRFERADFDVLRSDWEIGTELFSFAYLEGSHTVYSVHISHPSGASLAVSRPCSHACSVYIESLVKCCGKLPQGLQLCLPGSLPWPCPLPQVISRAGFVHYCHPNYTVVITPTFRYQLNMTFSPSPTLVRSVSAHPRRNSRWLVTLVSFPVTARYMSSSSSKSVGKKTSK